MTQPRLIVLLLVLLLVLVLVLVLALAGWLTFRLFTGLIEGRPALLADMKKQAEMAIMEAGGADVLRREAKAVLTQYRATPSKAWTNVERDERNYPATAKLYSLLSPDGHTPWVTAGSTGRPAHVVIRFGNHAKYAYVWLFDPADMPLAKTQGVDRLSEAVYLSESNE